MAIIAMSLICFLPALNAYGMLDPTDSFFFEVPREMIELGHYVTPIYNYTDWLDKPAFPFLLTVISYKLFGMNEFSARLPAALSGVILVVATYLLSLKKIGRRAAILSAVILSSSPLFLIVGHVALSDEVLSMLVGIPLLFIGAALASDKQGLNLIAYVFLALAVLCKGPIALVLVSGILCLYLLVVSSSWNVMVGNLLKLKPTAAILIIAGLCLPYYYLAHVTTAGAFTDQFFFRQNLGRLQGKVNHLEPVWFYLPVFFAGYFPWCFYLLFSVTRLKRMLAFRFQLTERQKFIVFCFCWFLFVAGLFTLIPTRLPTYVVPFSPALAVLTGCYLDFLLKAEAIKKPALSAEGKTREDILISIPPLLAFIATIVALFWLIIKAVSGPIFVVLSFGLLITAVISLFSVISFWSKKYSQAVMCLGLASVLGCTILVPAFFYWYYESRQQVMNRIITAVKEKDANLATLFSPVPSVVFYLKRQIPNVESMEELSLFCKRVKRLIFCWLIGIV